MTETSGANSWAGRAGWAIWAGPNVTRLFLIALVLGVGLSYFNSFGIGFYFDDSYGIAANPAIRSLRNIPRFFTDPFTLTTVQANADDVRPVLMITYALNYAISGLNPWSYHLLNLLLHGIAAMLVFVIVRDHLWWPASERGPNGAAGLPAGAAALFFALAPLNSQPVLYMWARSALLCVVLYLGAFLTFLRRRWAGGAVLYALALLTKAIAVTLPVMLVIYDWVYRDRERYPTLREYLSDWRRLFFPVLLSGSLVAAYIGYRAVFLPAAAGQARHEAWVTPWIWFMSQWSALVYYVRLFLWPDALSADHDFPYTMTLLTVRAWGSLVALAAWVALALRAGKKYPQVLFATAWFFITLAPESSFAPLGEVINDHRPYIATSLGLSVLLAWLLYRACTMLPAHAGKIAFAAVCIVLCIPAVMANHHRSWQWSDSLRLWDDTVQKSPNAGRAWMNAGLEYMSRGDTTTARNYFEHARALVPGYSYIHMNLSILEAHDGNLDKALAEAQEAVHLAPELSLSHFYLGNALQKIGRTADAAAEYRRAVDLDPNDSNAKAALAKAALANPAAPEELADEALMRVGLEELYKEGNPNAAAGHFRKVLEHTPTHYGAHFQLAMALDRAGKPDEAQPLWEQVLKLAEDYNDKPTADTARSRLQRGR